MRALLLAVGLWSGATFAGEAFAQRAAAPLTRSDEVAPLEGEREGEPLVDPACLARRPRWSRIQRPFDTVAVAAPAGSVADAREAGGLPVPARESAERRSPLDQRSPATPRAPPPTRA